MKDRDLEYMGRRKGGIASHHERSEREAFVLFPAGLDFQTFSAVLQQVPGFCWREEGYLEYFWRDRRALWREFGWKRLEVASTMG